MDYLRYARYVLYLTVGVALFGLAFEDGDRLRAANLALILLLLIAIVERGAAR